MICSICKRDAGMLFGPIGSAVCFSCAPWPKPGELDCIAYEDLSDRLSPMGETSYASPLPALPERENHRVTAMDRAWLRGEL